MKDIEIIGSDNIVERISTISPHLTERYAASIYFLNQSREENIEKLHQIWNVRAALYELKSAYETVGSTLPDRTITKIWEYLAQKDNLESHRLLRCLGKVRDLSIHTTSNPLKAKPFPYLLASPTGPIQQHSEEVFASPLEENKHTRKSGLSLEEITWFNRQAALWPLRYLIVEGWHCLAQILGDFTAKTAQNK